MDNQVNLRCFSSVSVHLEILLINNIKINLMFNQISQQIETWGAEGGCFLQLHSKA